MLQLFSNTSYADNNVFPIDLNAIDNTCHYW